MKLVTQILVNKQSRFYSECDKICFLSKNLYNQALYRVNKQYESDKTFLGYQNLTKQMSGENQYDFRKMQNAVSQQTLMLLEKNYKSYFAALKEYYKNPEKFKGIPMPPRFKHKTKGRFVAVFTENSISKKQLKLGFIKLAGVDFTFKSEHKKINQVRIIPLPNKNYSIEIIYDVQEKEVKENTNYAGVDIGLNNLATIVTNTGARPVIINGKPLKAINQYYNKKLAQLKSKLPHYIDKNGEKKQRKSSKAIIKLTTKRNNKIKDYMHKASRKVVNIMQQNDISKVVIGQNKEWKQSINLRKSTNQNFVAIPHARFISMCKYKHELLGIEQIEREESYTSKCSFLDNETIRKHNEYKGRRIKRGLFKSANGTKINADVNGSANVLKKEVPNAFADGIEGILVCPRVIKIF